MHKCLNELEIWQNLITDYRIICPWASEKSTFNLLATLVPLFFHRIAFILAGMKANRKISDKFEVWPDPTMDCGVTCPWTTRDDLLALR